MKNADKSRYGEIANLYDATLSFSGFRHGLETFLKNFDFNLPPEARVLDIGCGTGTAALFLAKQFPEITIFACDLDVKMLAKLSAVARRERINQNRFIVAQSDLKNPHALLVLETNQRLNLPNEHFDLILTSASLEHAPLFETVARFQKLLKPGGIFLNVGMKTNPMGKILGKIYDFKPHSIADINSACKAAGFNEITTAKLLPRHFPANLSRVATVAKK